MSSRFILPLWAIPSYSLYQLHLWVPCFHRAVSLHHHGNGTWPLPEAGYHKSSHSFSLKADLRLRRWCVWPRENRTCTLSAPPRACAPSRGYGRLTNKQQEQSGLVLQHQRLCTWTCCSTPPGAGWLMGDTSLLERRRRKGKQIIIFHSCTHAIILLGTHW